MMLVKNIAIDDVGCDRAVFILPFEDADLVFDAITVDIIIADIRDTIFIHVAFVLRESPIDFGSETQVVPLDVDAGMRLCSLAGAIRDDDTRLIETRFCINVREGFIEQGIDGDVFLVTGCPEDMCDTEVFWIRIVEGCCDSDRRVDDCYFFLKAQRHPKTKGLIAWIRYENCRTVKQYSSISEGDSLLDDLTPRSTKARAEGEVPGARDDIADFPTDTRDEVTTKSIDA